MAASDTQLQRLIDRALADDETAWDALLDHACDRLLRLTRRMAHGYPALWRWEQSDDVFQSAMLRLHRALVEVKPESVRHFFNLAAVQVRRELLDLAKHHLGPHGQAAHHHTDGQPLLPRRHLLGHRAGLVVREEAPVSPFTDLVTVASSDNRPGSWWG